MDFLGYAAFGGLERIAIISAALVIGYWGYRLYIGEKSAGLVFMSLACVVLLGALLTGGNHVRTVGETLQLAAIPVEDQAATIAMEETTVDADISATTTADLADSPFAAETNLVEPEVVEPAAIKVPAGAETAATIEVAATVKVAAAVKVAAGAEIAAGDADAEAVRQRLATAHELGGRIVSVKSENISLEWSPEPAN